MFQRMRTNIILIASALTLTAGTLLSIGGGQALAVTATQYYANVCLNAWGGGPWVNVETSEGAVPNDEFYVGTLSNGNSYIEFVGGGSWSGQCIGDAYNDPNDDYTSLDQCPTNSNSGGWGTNFKLVAGEDGAAYKNNHWNGYLWPTGNSNGDHFALLGPITYYAPLSPSQK